MQEIKLKFQIPPDRLDAVRDRLNALSETPPDSLVMHAAYLDTPDSALARHRMALRVRREGDVRAGLRS